MSEFIVTVDTLRAAVTGLILVAAIYSFVTKKVAPDLTALLAILALLVISAGHLCWSSLLVMGVLNPSEAFAGWPNQSPS